MEHLTPPVDVELTCTTTRPASAPRAVAGRHQCGVTVGVDDGTALIEAQREDQNGDASWWHFRGVIRGEPPIWVCAFSPSPPVGRPEGYNDPNDLPA